MTFGQKSSYVVVYGMLAVIALLVAAAYLLLMAGNSAQAQTSVPAAPTGLTAPSFTHSSVTLSWDDPGDSSITGYRILRRVVARNIGGAFPCSNIFVPSSAVLVSTCI